MSGQAELFGRQETVSSDQLLSEIDRICLGVAFSLVGPRGGFKAYMTLSKESSPEQIELASEWQEAVLKLRSPGPG